MDLGQDLTKRQVEILKKSVEDYIYSAQPITSGYLHSRYLRNVSSATIRNELNNLEQRGYLEQLHTSSGRIPTDKSYRLFVDSFMTSEMFDTKSLEMIKQMFTEKSVGFNEMMSTVAETLSEVTNYPAVVLVGGFDKLRIQSVNIIPIIGGRILLLISTNSGIIEQSIRLDENYHDSVFSDLSKVLTQNFKNKTLSEMILRIGQIQNNLTENEKEYQSLFDILSNCLVELTNKSQSKLFTRGSLKLLNNPEYENYKDVEEIIDTLQDNEKIERMFLQHPHIDVGYKIGAENKQAGLKKCSVISANYALNGEGIAKIGIIGPKRMDYSKVTSILNYIIGELTSIKQIPTLNKQSKTNISNIDIEDKNKGE